MHSYFCTVSSWSSSCCSIFFIWTNFCCLLGDFMSMEQPRWHYCFDGCLTILTFDDTSCQKNFWWYFQCILRVIHLRKYHGCISFVPAPGYETYGDPIDQKNRWSQKQDDNSEVQQCGYPGSITFLENMEWKIIEGPFISVWLHNVPWATEDTMPAPDAKVCSLPPHTQYMYIFIWGTLETERREVIVYTLLLYWYGALRSNSWEPSLFHHVNPLDFSLPMW